jgi:chemotaxis protein MotB
MDQFDKDVPVRIVKKKSRHGGGHHGGAWKVAYADFVTAMMALFIVLWIVGQSKQVKEYIAAYFKDPGAFFENTKGGGSLQSTPIGMMQQLPDELLKRQQDSLKLASMGEEIRERLGKAKELEQLKQQVTMQVVREGLRIELLDKSESFFFDVGTASLKPDAMEVLKIIASEVGRLPNHVILEGHTDSRKYTRDDGYTNFELSADRANSARRIMVRNGVQQEQVDEVRGYADTRLKNAADPFDVTNRRISIIVKFVAPQ